MLRPRAAEQDTGESGFTLIELLVAMGVFAVVLTISMVGIVSITENVRKSTNISDQADQLRRAFIRMDKSVRYASSIGTPGKSGSDWYVEFETTADNQDVCTQWRVRSTTKRLQTRSWQAKLSYTTANAWTTVATGIVNDPNNTAQQPFIFKPAPAGGRQQLDINLLGKRGRNSSGSAETKVSLVARNSGADSLPAPCDPSHSRS